MIRKHSPCLIILIVSLPFFAIDAHAVYTNNFESVVGAEWSKTTTDKTPNGSRKFLGQFGNEVVTLSLRKDGAGPVTVSFDLYLINSWDGNNTGYGPDMWQLRVVDGPELLRTTFSNLEENNFQQSFSKNDPHGNHPPGTDSKEYDSLGYTHFGDSVYRLSFTFNHSAEDVVLEFSASGLQDKSDESWGLDNIKVQGASTETTSNEIRDKDERKATISLVESNSPHSPSSIVEGEITLSIVGEDNNTLVKLNDNTPFRLQARYATKPDTAPTIATILWQDGREQVALSSTDDPKVFTSKWHYLASVAFRDFREVPGFRRTTGLSDKISAELFAGQWDVNHSGDEPGEARGVALVSDDGRGVRLLLVTENERIRYESFDVEATRDSTGGRHTLDVRFERKKEGEPWGPLRPRRRGSIRPAEALGASPIQPAATKLIPHLPDAPLDDARAVTESPIMPAVRTHTKLPDAPLGPSSDEDSPGLPAESVALDNRVIYLADGTKTIAAEVDGVTEDIEVELLNNPPERFRVNLMMREYGNMMSGAWSRERPDGSLGSAGQQTWGQAAKIEEVVVLEDQRPIVPKLGNYKQFMKDPNPRPADYIRTPPPSNADNTTEYPFREGAQNDSTRRRLFIYGDNLPQHPADAFNLKAGNQGFKYELVAFPGEGHSALFDLGWRKANIDKKERDSALIVEVEIPEGTKPGVKAFSLNGAAGYWHLDFADANAFIQFSHLEGENIDTGAGEFSAATNAYINDVIYVTLTEQAPLELEGLGIDLFRNGSKVASLYARRYDPPGEDVVHQKWCDQQRLLRGGVVGDNRDFNLWCKRSRGLPDYRSEPIRLFPFGPLLYEKDPNAGLSPILAPQIELNVQQGDVLTARIASAYRYQTRAIPDTASTTLISHPGELGPVWRDALKRTAACYPDGSKDLDFDAMTNEEAETYSKFIFTENLLKILFPLLPRDFSFREIKIKKGDHAAAILVRDEFLAMLGPQLLELGRIAEDDSKLWEFYQTRVSSTMPFWRIMKVHGPNEGWKSETDAFLKEMGYQASGEAMSRLAKVMLEGASKYLPQGQENGEWPIGDLIDTITTNPAGSGISERHAHLYSLRKTRQALLTLLDRAAKAYARAEKAGDCNVEELMLIGAQDAGDIVDRILPRLVQWPGDGPNAYWQPDSVARSYVKSLKVTGAEIAALESYVRIDEAYQALALAAVTAGAAASLTAGGLATAGAGLMLAADTADLIYFGSKTLDQYLESRPRIEYAQGATLGGIGEEFYNEAEAMRTEGWEAAVALLAPALGAASGARELRQIASVERGAEVLKGLKVLDADAIGRLPKVDQEALLSYFSDLHARRPGNSLRDLNNLGRVLDDAELSDFRKFADFYRENGLEVTGERLRQIGTPAKIADQIDEVSMPTKHIGSEAAAQTKPIKADVENSSHASNTKAGRPIGSSEKVGDSTKTDIAKTFDTLDREFDVKPLSPVKEHSGPKLQNGPVKGGGPRPGPEPTLMDPVNNAPMTVDNPPPVQPRTNKGITGQGDEVKTPAVRSDAETVRDNLPPRSNESATNPRRGPGDTETLTPKETSRNADVDPIRNEDAVEANAGKTNAEAARIERAEADTARPGNEAVIDKSVSAETLRQRLRNLEPGQVRINGEATPIDFGDYIGDGRTTTAFIDAGDPDNSIFRVLRRGYDPVDARIDEFGTQRLTSVEGGSNGLFTVTKEADRWVVRSVSDPRFADLEGAIITRVKRSQSSAAARVRSQGGRATRGQLHALDQTERYLNRNGLAWTDNHFDNFDFVAIDEVRDLWRIEVFDPGGIFPAKGNSAAERYANARAVQEGFNLPGEDWLREWRSAQAMPKGPKRTAAISALMDIRTKEAFNTGFERLDFNEVFGDGPASLIGQPMRLNERADYRGLAGLPPEMADELSLRYSGRAAPLDVPGRTEAPRPKPGEIDAAESRVFRENAGASPFREADTEMLKRTGTVRLDMDDLEALSTGTLRLDTGDIDVLGNETLILDMPEFSPGWAPVTGRRDRWSSPVGELRIAETGMMQGGYADVNKLLGPDGLPSGYVIKEYAGHTGKLGPHGNVLGQRARVRASAEGADRLKEAGILQAKFELVDVERGLLIQREINAGLPPKAIGENIVEDLIKGKGDRPTTLSKARSKGIAKMFRKLNNAGVVAEDPNIGNIFVRDFKGDNAPSTAGFLDQDRIIGENEFQALEHMEPDSDFLRLSLAEANGIAIDESLWVYRSDLAEPVLESRINLGQFRNLLFKNDVVYARKLQDAGMSLREIWAPGSGEFLLSNPKKFNYFKMIEKGWIKWEPGIGFSSGHLDLGEVVRELPDLPEVLRLPPGAEWEKLRSGETTLFDGRETREELAAPIMERLAA